MTITNNLKSFCESSTEGTLSPKRSTKDSDV